MLAFWKHGYEGTSITDLTSAMGVTAPSLYAAFGDKKRLFLEAARLYAGDPDDLARAIFEAPTAREAARLLLTSAAQTFTGEATPRGCLLASAAASGSAASQDVQKALAEIRNEVRARLRARIERDISSGALPSSSDAAGLSGLVMAVIQGMSVLARDGAADREALLAIAAAALRAWPETLSRP